MATTTPGSNAKGVIGLLIIGAVVWAVCSQSNSVGSGDYAPSGDSVALSGTATEQRLCAALSGPVNRLPELINAVSMDAESGISLALDGAQLELHLAMTNNSRKVQEDLDAMRATCMSEAG